MSNWMPCLILGSAEQVSLGHPILDEYLDLVRARARRNTLMATAYDLKVFFSVVPKDPLEVKTRDVLHFIKAQRQAPAKVVAIDGTGGMALSTIKRRLSSISGLYSYLVATERVDRHPVPRGLVTHRDNRRGRGGGPLIRPARRLPQVLSPNEVNALIAALHRWRDRAMVEAMVLGGLRRVEVLGLRFDDIRAGERRVFVADGKAGHQRLIPMSSRFSTLAAYLDTERPTEATTDLVFVVLKGPNRGQPLSAKGLEEILRGARLRAGLSHATCHELRHTCLTRLREAGMALEAVQAQAGHRSIASTRVYLHLANDWLANEYRKAAEAIDAQVAIGAGR